MDQASRQRIGIALALTAAFLWGVSGAVSADVFEVVPPARVAQARALLAAAVMVPYVLWRGAMGHRGQLGWLALFGVNLAVVNVTFYWAVELLGVGPGATIQFLAPILVLGWMVKVQKRTVSMSAWAAAIFAVAGAGLVTRAPRCGPVPVR